MSASSRDGVTLLVVGVVMVAFWAGGRYYMARRTWADWADTAGKEKILRRLRWTHIFGSVWGWVALIVAFIVLVDTLKKLL